MRRVRATADRGFTLVEAVVSMSVMLVALMMFTGGVLLLFRSAATSESISNAQSQLHVAFVRLDREIRYAAGISTPNTTGPDFYVEYLTTNTGTAVCTQLRLHSASGQLQRRTWTQGSPPAAAAGWVPVASGVRAAKPFEYLAPTGPYNYQRLRVRLGAAGEAGGATRTETDVTFTALNTDSATSSAAICGEGRP